MEDLIRAVKHGYMSLQEFRDKVAELIHPSQMPTEPWKSSPDGGWARRADPVVMGVAVEDLKEGDLVKVNVHGNFEIVGRGAPIGVALADGVMRVGDITTVDGVPLDQLRLEVSDELSNITPRPETRYEELEVHDELSNITPAQRARLLRAVGAQARALPAHASYYTGSQAYAGSLAWATMGRDVRDITQRRGNRFQYSKFSEEAEAKAWKLIEKYMSAEQYFAFMEGTTVELVNKAETHRLLINRNGDFTILQGIKAGAGITESEGKIHSYKYPLGDEISAFLDWFRHRTGELIANWNCGNYGIVKEGERR